MQRALEACGGEGNRAKLEKSQFAGHDLYYLTIPQPGFPLTPSCCLTEHELVLGLFPQYVKAYLNRSKDAVSLAKAPAVATMFASGKAPLKIVYEDTPQLVKSFYPMVQLLARPLAQVEKQGIHFDYSTLPSVETLLKHLRPSTTAVVRTNAGLEIDSRCTLPLPSLTTTPVAAGLLIPAIQAARSARGGRNRPISSNNIDVPIHSMRSDAATNGTRIKHGLIYLHLFSSVFDPCSIRGQIGKLFSCSFPLSRPAGLPG